MSTLAERITADRIDIETSGGGYSRDETGWEYYEHTVKLTRPGQEYVLSMPFKMGLGLAGAPTAEMVLESLLSGAASIENADGFEDWASEYGYDTDSRKAERDYKATKAQTVDLQEFLGDEYEAYLWETDRD